MIDLPSKQLNIYPKTEENLKALFGFYFDEFDLPTGTAVDDCLAKKSLSLNQIEFIVGKLAKAYPIVFKGTFNSQADVSLLLLYGFCAFTKSETEWPFGPTSSARPKLHEFIRFCRDAQEA